MKGDNTKFGTAQRITQHKRFALKAHPNFCFAKTSFMLETLPLKCVFSPFR